MGSHSTKTTVLVLPILTMIGAAMGCAAQPANETSSRRTQSVLSPAEVMVYAHVAGVPCDRLPMAASIAMAESGFDTDARSVNVDGTVDRGLWQINDYWHPDVDDGCAYDAQCNANAMAAISANGTNWQPWSTYNNGAFQRYLDTMNAAYASGVDGCTDASTPPPAASGTCHSDTLGRDVDLNTCVQSSFDSQWYQCTSSGWRSRWDVPDACVAEYPL